MFVFPSGESRRIPSPVIVKEDPPTRCLESHWLAQIAWFPSSLTTKFPSIWNSHTELFVLTVGCLHCSTKSTKKESFPSVVSPNPCTRLFRRIQTCSPRLNRLLIGTWRESCVVVRTQSADANVAVVSSNKHCDRRCLPGLILYPKVGQRDKRDRSILNQRWSKIEWVSSLL